MKEHVSNAAFGALDYLAYPVGMLLLAPQILHSLGVERYGIWAISCAVLNTGAILASGFGDANIRAVAIALGARDHQKLVENVRASLGIHLILACFFATIAASIAPAIARNSVRSQGWLDCLWSLRIAAITIGLRAIETVCVSTQRAFGRYGAAIRFSVAARVLSICAAAWMPSHMRSAFYIMLFTLFLTSLSVWFQFRALHRILGKQRILPQFRAADLRALLKFGGYTWGQAAAGTVFGQVDRIYAGVVAGAAAVTPYVFCVQLTQPIFGVTAAGWHFLFPHIASLGTQGSNERIRRTILIATGLNALFVAIALLMTIRLGPQLLRYWAGSPLSASADSLLAPIAIGTALPAFAVTGVYSLLAIGKPHIVTTLTILGGIAMQSALPVLAHRFGLQGIAFSRIFYGIPAITIFIPLAQHLRLKTGSIIRSEPITAYEDA